MQYVGNAEETRLWTQAAEQLARRSDLPHDGARLLLQQPVGGGDFLHELLQLLLALIRDRVRAGANLAHQLAADSRKC